MSDARAQNFCSKHPRGMITDPYFFVFAIPAVIFFGLSKGGFSGVSALGTPLMAMAVPPTRAAVIILPILLVQDALGWLMFRREWDRSIVFQMLPGAAIGIGAAYLFSRQVPQSTVGIVLGAISIIFAARMSPPSPSQGSRARCMNESTSVAFLSGGASGFASMIAHAGGPPFQFYVFPKHLPRDLYIGTSIVFFAAVNCMKVVPFVFLGQFSQSDLFTSATLLPIALTSTWGGVHLAKRFTTDQFFTLVRILMVAAGSILIGEGVFALIG